MASALLAAPNLLEGMQLLRWTSLLAAFCLLATGSSQAQDNFNRARLTQFGVDVVDAAMIQGQEWEDIHEGAKKYSISEEMVDEILRAGLNLTCPGKDHNNGGSYNAWLIGNDGRRFYTNAHAFLDGADLPVTPFYECGVQLMSEIDRLTKVGTGSKAPAYSFNVSTLVVASVNPRHLPLSIMSNDRATATLEASIPGSRSFSRMGVSVVNVGQDVFVFSRKPPKIRKDKYDLTPIIQRCAIKRFDTIDASTGISQIRTNCSSIPGNSGDLYFVRDPEHDGRLLPIAMGWGAIETPDQSGTPKDGLPFDENSNAGMAILLTPGFFVISTPPPD